jgi:hypothetical protein
MKKILSLIISAALVVSGFGQTRNVLVGTNSAVVQPTNFWSADASNARSGLGLGATNDATFNTGYFANVTDGNFQLRFGATNTGFRRAGGGETDLVVVGSNVARLKASEIVINTVSGISFANTTNAAITRTNLGLGWSALTNTDATNFRTAIGLNETNNVMFNGLLLGGTTNTLGNYDIYAPAAKFEEITIAGYDLADDGSGNLTLFTSLFFNNTSNAATTRTNLGLPWSGLTNTNAATFQAALFGTNTNPVLVDTNGSVVSPTNFWAVAPISTTVQYQTNVTGTSTNAATNSRNLFLFSLAPSVSGVTNTVTLPTNPVTTFEGDRATIIHLAQTTNALTAIRQLGAATNLITINQLDETVLLMYRSGAWRLADNISYVEPIFFSGTNAAANAAASRTNLGLVWSGLTNTNDVTFQTALFSTNRNLYGDTGIVEVSWDSGQLSLVGPISWPYLGGATAVAQTRTNLGIPLSALTNTNNANFQAAVFATNSNPTNAGNFNNHVAWMEVTVQTNGSNVSFRVPLYK